MRNVRNITRGVKPKTARRPGIVFDSGPPRHPCGRAGRLFGRGIFGGIVGDGTCATARDLEEASRMFWPGESHELSPDVDVEIDEESYYDLLAEESAALDRLERGMIGGDLADRLMDESLIGHRD